MTHPCSISLHSDRFLGNSAAQEGGGFMVYGGTGVLLQNVRVSCNAAQSGAGLMVRLSDSSDDSELDLRCSQVTANGGLPEPAALQACLEVLASAEGATQPSPPSPAADNNPDNPGVLLAAIAAAAGGSDAGGSSAAGGAAGPESLGGAAPAAAAAEKGGGLYVAAAQRAYVSGSVISGNRASSSGAGVYLDRNAALQLRPVAAGAGDSAAAAAGGGGVLGSSVSYNNCTGGSGGGAFMDEGSTLDAADATWSNNQVGGVAQRDKPSVLGMLHLGICSMPAAAEAPTCLSGTSRAKTVAAHNQQQASRKWGDRWGGRLS